MQKIPPNILQFTNIFGNAKTFTIYWDIYYTTVLPKILIERLADILF